MHYLFKKNYNLIIEVVCRDRCGRNTQMFNKKFITIDNQQVNNLYDSHLWLTIESLQSRISACVCFAMMLNLSHFAAWSRMTLLFETKRILFLVALRYPYYTRVY